MRRPLEIAQEEQSMRTIVTLTSTFESLASMRIFKTKKQVITSNKFFDEVWNIYKLIRIDGMFNFGRTQNEVPNDKELYILITAPGGLTGDIDQRLVRLVKKTYDPEKHDIIVIGRHGAAQLKQANIEYKQYFKLPEKDIVNVDPLMKEVKKYKSCRVFYESYLSLSAQKPRSIDLAEIIETKGRASAENVDDLITEATYIFEPTPYAVVAHMETSMLRLTLTQLIYDSRLAQTASRFKAMSLARERATDTVSDLHTEYNRARRNVVDQRLKEVIAGLKKARNAT